MNNVVYMFGCTNCTLTVKGKINSIFIDSCRKSSIVFDTVVSSAEFVNCQSVQMQVGLCLFINFNFIYFSYEVAHNRRVDGGIILGSRQCTNDINRQNGRLSNVSE